MQVHGYPYSRRPAPRSSSRCTRTCGAGRLRRARRAHRFRARRERRGGIARLRELFADMLDGHAAASPTTRSGSTSPPCATSAGITATWCSLGDAAHTAHFSIGSGTKLAMEDSLALAACLHEHPDVPTRAGGLRGGAPPGGRVDAARRAGVASSGSRTSAVREQRAAAVRLQPADPATGGHLRQPPRSRPGLRRDVNAASRAAGDARPGAGSGGEPRPPMFQPFRLARP